MRILLVRHAEATGQDPEAQLTQVGIEQAEEVCQFISKFFKVSRIVSSPYLRAIKTIEPLSTICNGPISTDDNLVECYYAEDWSNETADQGLERGLNVVKALQETEGDGVAVVVSHGDLIGLLLKHFGNETYVLTRPDLYLLEDNKITHLWSETGAPKTLPRHSARAILFSHDRSKVFLFELAEPAISSNNRPTIWITPGGGVEDGEDLVSCLQRELFEELGLSPKDYEVLGRLWTARTPMIIRGIPKIFIEEIFAVQLDQLAKEVFNFDRQSEEEKRVLKRFKWWTIKELETTEERIMPGLMHKVGSIDLDSLSMTEPLAIIDEPV